MIEAARALGFRAVREADGQVSLTVPGSRLPPRLRELAEEIADAAPAPRTAAELLVRVLVWARRAGHPVESVLADSAGDEFASPDTVADLVAVMERERIASDSRRAVTSCATPTNPSGAPATSNSGRAMVA